MLFFLSCCCFFCLLLCLVCVIRRMFNLRKKLSLILWWCKCWFCWWYRLRLCWWLWYWLVIYCVLLGVLILMNSVWCVLVLVWMDGLLIFMFSLVSMWVRVKYWCVCIVMNCLLFSLFILRLNCRWSWIVVMLNVFSCCLLLMLLVMLSCNVVLMSLKFLVWKCGWCVISCVYLVCCKVVLISLVRLVLLIWLYWLFYWLRGLW